MIVRVTGIAVWFALCLMVSGAPADVGAENTARTFLIHITTLPNSEDPFRDIPLMVLAALEKGYAVSMLFDGPAVKVSRLGAWYGGDTTILDRMPVPESAKQVMAEKVGLSAGSFPDNHGDLLRFLRGRGVNLYVSQEAMAQYSIMDEDADNVFASVPPERMVSLFAGADVYVSY